MKVLVVSKIVVPLQTLSPPNNYDVKSQLSVWCGQNKIEIFERFT